MPKVVSMTSCWMNFGGSCHPLPSCPGSTKPAGSTWKLANGWGPRALHFGSAQIARFGLAIFVSLMVPQSERSEINAKDVQVAAYMYIYIYAHTHTHMYTYLHLYMYIYIYI